ncbi:U3 small nucleolar ribonucleoprotein protein MPP10-like [Tigriopus californicus]|uniref:U3 small nucleolar ribonucleoprotein protein MPP10-like n=1 Tax=Tigriopus californicus TaxID=6832 RepID=UPI0027D9DA32|nr:U3 small nucleolar ribonucleoprotein protein MPP10-like [Tigriopus californicus]
MEAILSQTRSKVQSLIAKPEQFLQSPKESLILTSQSITKILYDLAKLNEDPEDQSGKAKSTLKELIIEGFDHEQIWAQIQLQNEATLPSLQKQIWLWENGPKEWNLLAGTKRVQNKRKLELENGIDLEDPKKGKYEEPQDDTDEDDLNGMNDMNDPIQEAETDDDYDSEKEAEEEEVDLEDDQEENEEDAIFNDPDFQNMSDSDGDDLPLFENAKSEDEASEDEEEREKKELERETKKKAIDSQADDYLAKAMSSIRQKKTEVDDDFFKLNDMASFLDQEDQKEDRRRMREERGLENDDDDDDDDGIDLFDDVGGNSEEEQTNFQGYFGSGDTPQGDLNEDEPKLEAEAVSTDKPWQLKGEIAGPARPENSLLQEHLDYETVAKQAPIITEAVSKRLEDIILRRIKDKAWDDVERKIKPVEDPYEYKKRLVLDQEKSKLSLAEVYEQDYLKKKSDLENADKTSGVLDREDEDDPKEVEAIKASMHALFAKLNTLTHFHYTPQNVNTDVKIVKNVPAIAIEEVAPISHSDAALLAPQEMLEKGGKRELELDATEKTETDRKRERRKKKTKQRAIRKDKEQREKLVNKLNPGLGNKYSKEKMKKELQRAEKKGEITSLKDKGQAKGVKSSSAFFNQLQEETHNVVKRAKEESQKQKNKASSKASKFKL